MSGLVTDEIIARDAFYSAHSTSIPDDLCLAISNLPQTFMISSDVPNDDGIHHPSGDSKEILPAIDDDLLLEVSSRGLASSYIDVYSLTRRLVISSRQHQHNPDMYKIHW